MKGKEVGKKIMHFLVHNSILFTVAIMGLVHASLLGIMIWADVPMLINLNILSVVVYLFCVLLCRTGHIMPVFISILLEVTIYSILAVHNIGWSSGSWAFLFSIVPIIIYFGCFLFKGSQRWVVVLSLILNFAIYVFLYFRYVNSRPVFELSFAERSVLTIFSAFVMVVSMIFYSSIYIYASEVEMTTLEQRNKQLSADAKKDALTGLLNRRGFLPLVEALMNDSASKYFCIAFCDIDNFKRINDSYGHDCGDEVLRHITKMVRKEMHGCEICRWGGEEIVILMRDHDLAVAQQKMEYVRRHIEANPTAFYNKRISTTITAGLEENKDIYTDPEEIIKVADQRMYYGKQHGKNIVISEDH